MSKNNISSEELTDRSGSSTSVLETKKISIFEKMHQGNGLFPIIPHRKFFFMFSLILVLIFLATIIFRGFTFGIEFEGGTQVTFPTSENISTTEVGEVFTKSAGQEAVSVQTIGSGSGKSIQIRSETLTQQQVNQVKQALFDSYKPKDQNGKVTPDNISFSEVSSTWGKEITKKALRALVVFIIIVMLYITLRFERDMAIAAVIALVFDLLTTAGVYSLVGFEVAPATVIGLLTILGYSLYDTVVVFDKVKENTANILKTRKRTYAEAANLAVNETLIRSINTSIISIIPILSLMVISIMEMGVGVLKDLSLVLLIGILAGTFSSIFIATPLLVQFKSMQKPYAEHDARVKKRRLSAIK